jgi:hypothetical protein
VIARAEIGPICTERSCPGDLATLLSDARWGRCGRILLWALLVAGTVASLVADVAVAQPTATGRISP